MNDRSTLALLPDEQARVRLHMPVDVRSVSLVVIAVIASLYALQWAKPVLVPILFGLMMSQALTPIVNRLQRWHVPRALGAALVLLAIASGLVWSAMALNGQANDLVKTLPQVSRKVRQLVRSSSGSISVIDQVQRAANELQGAPRVRRAPARSSADDDAAADASASAASDAAASPSSPGGEPVGDSSASTAAVPSTASASAPAPVRKRSSPQPNATTTSASAAPDKPGPDIQGYLLSGTIGALDILGQTAIAFFVALFLMSAGDSFRRKMVRLAGPTLTQKRVTVETMNEITAQVQRYMVVQLLVSVLVGVATGLAFFALGLRQAAVWGVVAGVTNLIPYLGAILIGAGSAIVGMVQFNSVQMALVVGAVSFGIHSVVGNVLTPWWMGRASRMSAFAVFVAVLLFGWLWGISGLLLGVPILMALKSICDRVDDLKPIGELLGA